MKIMKTIILILHTTACAAGLIAFILYSDGFALATFLYALANIIENFNNPN